jgi:hypothetical protein
MGTGAAAGADGAAGAALGVVDVIGGGTKAETTAELSTTLVLDDVTAELDWAVVLDATASSVSRHSLVVVVDVSRHSVVARVVAARVVGLSLSAPGSELPNPSPKPLPVPLFRHTRPSGQHPPAATQ